jgi:FMN-dependent NADH-azoreductase
MAQVLFVKGHPATAESSVTLQLAESFLAAYKASNPGDTIQTVDLYQDNIPQIDGDVMSAWGKFMSGRANELTATEGAKVGRLGELADQFIAAEKVIFAAPMWNFSYPAMVKAYIDGAVVVQGKTFKYTATGPVGLLKDSGKKVVLLEASGGQYTGTPMHAHTAASNHLKAMLNFVGIDDVQVLTAEGMAQDPVQAPAIIAAAKANAASHAVSF